MYTPPDDESVQESIEEVEEKYDYSFDFDDDEGGGEGLLDSLPPQQQQQQQQQQSSVVSAVGEVQSKQARTGRDDPSTSRLLDSRKLSSVAADSEERNRNISPVSTPTALRDSSANNGKLGKQEQQRSEQYTRDISAAGVEDAWGRKQTALPVQVLALKARLDGIVQRVGHEGDLTAREALTRVTREHAALRECLGGVEQELVSARRKVTQDAAERLCAVRQKRARAEARRVQHFEQLGEARRAAATAKAESKALRARLEDAAAECLHTREMLEAARSSRLSGAERAKELQKEAEMAKDEAEGLRMALAELGSKAEEERKRAADAARCAVNKLELCERKRELEVDAAKKAAEARERVAELQLQRLPEHQQELLQTEMGRLARWEERLSAEALSLQRREEGHKIEREADRVQARRTDVEARARAEEDVVRERSSLREAREASERERGELLQRVARAEAVGQAQIAEVAALMAEATETRRRVEAEKYALDTKAALLAPQFQVLKEERAALEEARREAKEEARRARDEACRARELEAGVVEREAVVEVKWEETAAARRAAKQMERSAAEEAETLSEQRKAVAVARVRLHEQQMEVTLQMSEIRKALDLMKRVESFGNSGTRRLALELGTLDLERADKGVARRMNTGTDMADGYARSGVVIPASGWHKNRESLLTAHGKCEDIGERGYLWPTVGGARVIEQRNMRGAYADEAGAREALEKVRSAIAAVGGGAWGGSESGAGWEGLDVQAWAGKLQAAAIASGALT